MKKKNWKKKKWKKTEITADPAMVDVVRYVLRLQ